MRILLLATAALALSACSKSGSGNNSSDAAPTAMQEQVPANLTMDPGNQMVPIAQPSPSPVAGIPAPFQGRWGMVGKDCVPGRGDAKGLMIVSGDALTFYESHATIGRADRLAPGSLSLKLDYLGEGKRWSDTETLTLVDPQTLVREAKSPAGSFRYSRCPK
ncbi:MULTISPECIES: hypothetical protein [unclassified Sphingomonas]|uniref:hypothetical protein n=1 Tax=unclassified Sphingomonas TaxID=196159 RepID=UPI00226AB4F6|nr:MULTISPECIES: hypothetical protein [unclassified Sphingomonas]